VGQSCLRRFRCFSTARIAGLVVGTFDEDEPGLVLGGGAIEFLFGWRLGEAGHRTVFVAKQAEVEAAAIHLVEINLVGTTVGGGQILEQEDLEEATQQRVAANVIADGLAFLGQFLLHTADEEAFAHAWLPLALGAVPLCAAVFMSDPIIKRREIEPGRAVRPVRWPCGSCPCRSSDSW